jgi:hypothetical protein
MIKPALAAATDDSFETLLLTELEIVRSGEERLERLFPKLRLHPHLQECFLQELAEVQQRAERLDAILNGTATLEIFPAVHCSQLPAA